MTTEERFRAAVNVIKSLPKNGSYQPSPQMLLTFYAYYKQATEGPCKQSRPAFWDVIGRAKHDSWAGLGSMSKERAMQGYVDELKKIIETMSFTEDVADFVGSISEIENVDVNDLDLVAPEAMQHARSRPGSPFASREASPQRAPLYNGVATAHMNGHVPVSESDDEFNSADESDIPNRQFERQHISRRGAHLEGAANAVAHSNSVSISQHVNSTIDALNNDIKMLQSKYASLELAVDELKKAQSNRMALRHPTWWPFKNVSPSLVLFVILWPIVVNRIFIALQKNRSK